MTGRLKLIGQGLAAILLCSAPAAAPASAIEACGQLPQAQAQRSDPYTAYRAFVRSVSALAAETAGVDAAARRDAVYAQGRVLRDFSRDLKTAARAPLAAALDALEAQRCTGAASSNADPALLLRAAEAVQRAVPRAWLHPSASLRGRDQPGSPLRMQD